MISQHGSRNPSLYHQFLGLDEPPEFVHNINAHDAGRSSLVREIVGYY